MSMKAFKLLLVLTMAGTGFNSVAQGIENPEEIRSLFSKENEIKGFGGVDMHVTDLYKERTLMLGAYGGAIINKHVMFGLAGYGIATENQFRGASGDMLNMEGGYGGLYLGGIIFPNEVVHLAVPVLFGAGALHIVDKQYFPTALDKEYVLESTALFVVKPSVQLEVNITQFLRIGVGASYRYIRGSDLRNISDDELTEWGGTFSVRVGRF